MSSRICILGVPIDNVTLSEAVERMRLFIQSDFQHHLCTPNPEMLVAASKDSVFREVLQSSSLNIPDGAGLLFAASFLGKRLKERVTGIDLLQSFCMEGSPSVFFLGAAPGVAEKAARVLQEHNPSLVIAGTYSGSPSIAEEDDIIRRINESKAVVLFVAFGAPAQDLWIARTLHKMPSVRVAMGVGGSFDFLAHVRKRSPLFLQSMHLEWLWRLLLEPRRLQRIFTAVILFPLLVLRKQGSRSC